VDFQQFFGNAWYHMHMKSTYNPTVTRIIGGTTVAGLFLISLYTVLLFTVNTFGENGPGGVFVDPGTPTPQSASPDPIVSASATPSPTAAATASSTPSSGYRNGTYTTSVTYSVPRSQNGISIALTINNGTITAATASHQTGDEESEFYTGSFQEKLQGTIVGKELDTVSVSRLGGASLTSAAFTRALSTIRSNASL
jgi:uncharacterized protein with FMN-binding domain